MADINNILMGVFGGLAGDPMFPLKVQQQKINMQMAMERLKQESEQNATESQYRKALMKKLEMEIQNQQMPVEYETGGEVGKEQANTTFKEGKAAETPLTETGQPRLKMFQTPKEKRQIPLGMFEKLAPKLQERVGAKWLGLPEPTEEEALKAEKSFTLGPGQVRFKGKKEIARGEPKEEKEPTFESAIEYAGALWPGGDYKTKEGRNKFFEYIKRPEGEKYLNQKLSEWTKFKTPSVMTYLPTAEGFVPASTRGAGAGTIGKPTGLGKPVPQETQNALAFIGQIKDSLNTFKDKLKESGWYGPIGGAYGETLGRFLPTPEAYELMRPIAANLMDIVYPKSGKAINLTELDTLYKYVPRMTDKKATIDSKMKNFERHLNSIEENYKKQMSEGGVGKDVGKNPSKTVIRTGTDKKSGKKVIEYSDGSIEYAK